VNGEPKRILVVLLGLLGDTLMRLPLVRALHHRYPEATISAVCDPPLADALSLNPLFDSVHPFDRRGISYADQIRFYLRLRRLRSDLLVDMYFGARTPILAWFSGARRRVGLGNYWYGKVLLSDVIRPPFPQIHMVDRHLPLLEPLGITSLRRVWEFPLADRSVTALTERLTAAGLLPLPNSDDVAVAVGAGDVTKRWDAERLDAALTALAGGALGAPRRVFLVADVQEPRLTERWRGRDRLVVLPSLTLAQIGALFRQVGLVLTPDSGLMHVALATAPRHLVYFQSTHPQWHDAERPAYRYLYRKICPVQPCDTRLKHTCQHECRRSLPVDEMLAAAAELLALPAWDGRWPENRVTLDDVRRQAAALRDAGPDS
jgi:heptosyltransferase-1